METGTFGIEVRDALISDVEAIAQMARELAAVLKDPPPPISAELLKSILIGDDRWCECLVAVASGNIAGYAVGSRYFEPHTGTRRLVLADLYVAPNRRKHGVGRQLFARMLDRARALRCQELTWEVWDENEPAFAFYEKLGAKRIEGVSFMRFATV